MDRTPCFDKSDFGLHEYRSEIWEGFIYVNLDGAARPTKDLWGPMSAQLAEYGLSDWKVVDSIDWGESAWDWKVFMDNGECYHHIGAHHDTLEPVMPARLVVDLPDNGEYTLLYACAAPEILAEGPDGELDFASLDRAPTGLTSQQRTGLGLAYPFPNYVLAAMPHSAYWLEAQPMGPGRIDFVSHLLLPPHVLDEPGLQERIAGHNATLEAIHLQDIVVCEGVQRGLATSAARPGMLAHLERHNQAFARWYAKQMVDGQS